MSDERGKFKFPKGIPEKNTYILAPAKYSSGLRLKVGCFGDVMMKFYIVSHFRHRTDCETDD